MQEEETNEKAETFCNKTILSYTIVKVFLFWYSGYFRLSSFLRLSSPDFGSFNQTLGGGQKAWPANDVGSILPGGDLVG